jgi:hypothetical protein
MGQPPAMKLAGSFLIGKKKQKLAPGSEASLAVWGLCALLSRGSWVHASALHAGLTGDDGGACPCRAFLTQLQCVCNAELARAQGWRLGRSRPGPSCRSPAAASSASWTASEWPWAPWSGCADTARRAARRRRAVRAPAVGFVVGMRALDRDLSSCCVGPTGQPVSYWSQ